MTMFWNSVNWRHKRLLLVFQHTGHETDHCQTSIEVSEKILWLWEQPESASGGTAQLEHVAMHNLTAHAYSLSLRYELRPNSIVFM